VAVSLSFFVLGQIPQVRVGVEVLYEEAALALNPSAERAYGYGMRHFDAPTHSASYDIVRAEHLFRRALILEPQYPLAHHQLGRVAFLRGDFSGALWHLDKEMENNPEPSLSTYYMRGLVLGFMERPEEAIPEFERFLESEPATWAALNDYAWVLLKAGRFAQAAVVAQQGLEHMPESPWLLNTAAIAFFELGDLERALVLAQSAADVAEGITQEQWLGAYPGNDPRVAQDGILALRQSTLDNLRTIERALAGEAVQ
jgi:tetratricopeptide (TPR) repeat protein